MTENSKQLDSRQLASLEAAFHEGAAVASQALAKWLGKNSVLEIDGVEQLPVAQASDLLAASDEQVCFCSVEISGLISGEMILAFDDTSGLALAEMVLDQPSTNGGWSEVAISAALETTNILCCAYVNALSDRLSADNPLVEIMPSPPVFSRDFAGSLLEFAFMGQLSSSDDVFAVRTRFEVDATRLNWTLLFVPDASTIARLPQLIAGR